MITRQQAINLFGSAVELASALGYTSRHAIYMWPKSGDIPEAPYLKIRYQLKPDAFNADGSLKASGKPANLRKQVAGNDPVLDPVLHGTESSRKAGALKTPRVKGGKGEVAHG
jgi:hypothetical protein